LQAFRRGLRTLAAKDDGKVPELRHVVCLEHLTLVGSTISVQGKGNVLLVLVLACESNTSTNGNLGADDTVSTVESGSEHVHRSTLAVSNALSPAEQFANNGLDGSSAHEGEAVAAVGGDEMVLAVDGVFNTNGDGFLSGRQMAETPNLLLLVESVGGHFHASTQTCQNDWVLLVAAFGVFLPYGDHVVVHLLQLLLGDIECVRRGVELVCLEGLVGETDLEGLVILLGPVSHRSAAAQLPADVAGEVFSYLRHVLPLGMR
jgi:hypothetical protein